MASNAVGTVTGRKERCASCDASLSGPYCSRCGERVLEPEALTLRHFLFHTVAHELLHLDGTLWQTLRLLFVHPGQLSLEYVAGRRRPYVNPFRLLLISIVAFALMTASGFHVTLNLGPLITSLAPAAAPRRLAVEDTITQVDHYGLLRQQLTRKSDQLKTESARERFHDRLEAFAEPLSFANVILLATVLYLCFRSKRPRFLEHVAFSMHVVSFVLLSSVTMLLAIRLRSWLHGYGFTVLNSVVLWQFAYLCVAIRRFYLAAGRWGARVLSVAAAILIYMLNTAFMSAVQVAGAALALGLA